jgi:raffinose/stachyose/melibiose transport system substrate-binding protein
MAKERKTMNKKATMALILLLGAALVSCGPATTAETPTAEACPDGVVTLDFAHFYSPGVGYGDWLAQISEEYEATHPCVKIKWNFHFDDYYEYVPARFASGDPPDTFMDHIQIMVMGVARTGGLRPVDDYLDQWKDFEGQQPWREIFSAKSLEQAFCDVEGCADMPGTMCIPDDYQTTGFYYRVDLFEQYGLEEPQTWQELMSQCKQLLDQGKYCFTSDADWAGYTNYWYNYLAARIVGGQTLLDTALHKPGTSWQDEQGFLTAAKELYDAAAYFVPGWSGNAWPSGQNDFANGGSLMILHSTWLPSEIKPVVPGLKLGWFPFPCYEGSKADCSEQQFTFNCWTLSRQCEHPDEVMEFLQLLTSKKYQDLLVDYDTPPARLGAATSDLIQEPLAALDSASSQFTFGWGISLDAPVWEENVYSPLVQKLMFREITPEEFIATLQKESDDWYATHTK